MDSLSLPEFLTAAASSSGLVSIDLRVKKADVYNFRRAKVGGKHIGDLDKAVKDELKVLEAAVAAAEASVAEAANGYGRVNTRHTIPCPPILDLV